MQIPHSSVPRLSLYYRTLLSLKERSIISSRELSELTGCSAAQIRKDLAYFGQFGRPGIGYATSPLRTELKKILGIDKKWNVALVGVGNLGSALLAYKGFKNQGFNIVCAFDNDPGKINYEKDGVTIQHISRLRDSVKAFNLKMAIVAVPHESAQDVVDEIVASGVKAVVNFAPARPRAPKRVKILNIDLSAELERLSFFLKSLNRESR